MELVRSVVHFELDRDGNAVAGNIERIYTVTDVSGTYQRQMRDVLSASDLVGLLPDQGSLVLQLQAANAEKAAAIGKASLAETARDEAIASKDQAIADRDAAVEAKSIAEYQAATAIAERDAAIRERDEVFERYAPKEVGGFPVLTPVQIRRGLRTLGVLPENVLTAIDQIPDEAARADAHDQWEYALGFERAHPLIVGLGLALGLNSDDIDTAWRAAASL